MAAPRPAEAEWPRRSSIALCAILLAAPWYYGGYPDFARYGMEALVLCATALWFWSRPPLESRLVVPTLSFGAWALVQAVLRLTSSPVSTIESALVLGAALAVFVLVATQASDKRAAGRWAFVVIAVCVCQAAFGIVQESLTPRQLYGVSSEFITSPYGSYYNHNHFAGLVEMGAILAAGLALGRARKTGTIDPGALVLGGASLGLAGAVVASRSRGGLLALTVGAVVLVPLWLGAQRAREGRRSAMLAALAVGVLFLGFGWMVVPAPTRAHLATLLSGPADSSGQYRVATYQATLDLARRHPLGGAGLGTFADAVGPFRRGSIRAPHADSDVLEFASEAGLIGIVLLAWVAGAGLQGFRLQVTESHDPFRKGVAVGALAAVVALFVHSLVDFNLRLPANALVFSTLAGLASASRTPNGFRLFPWPRALALVAAVLAALAGWRCLGALEYGYASKIGDPHRRLAALTDAVHRHPYLASLWLERAATWSVLAKGDPVVTHFRLERALADAEQAALLRSAWPEAWMNLGWIHLRLQDQAGARAAMEHARALDPARVSLGLQRAEFFTRIADSDAAIQELVQLRQYNRTEWPRESAQQAAQRLGLDPVKVEKMMMSGDSLR